MLHPGSLRIGLPGKGRLSKAAIELFSKADYLVKHDGKKLSFYDNRENIDFLFLRTQDIPPLIAAGIIDLGVSGTDNVFEKKLSLTEILPLEFGQCRLCVAASKQTPYDGDLKDFFLQQRQQKKDRKKNRIVTSFPNITNDFFLKNGIDIECIVVQGSVEIMISLHGSDAIVDLVDTGKTLENNGLKVLETIGDYHCSLLAKDDLSNKEKVDEMIKRLKGIILSSKYSILEYNILKTKLKEAEKITPGFDAPTISHLDDSSRVAVKVMIQKSEVISAMNSLEKIGASGIFETVIRNCRL